MNKEFVRISKFAESRGQSKGTVNAFIRKHPEIEKNCKRDGKEKLIEVDSEGYKILDEKYPYVKPVQIVQDVEAMQELIESQKQNIELQKQLMDDKIATLRMQVKKLKEDTEKLYYTVSRL